MVLSFFEATGWTHTRRRRRVRFIFVRGGSRGLARAVGGASSLTRATGAWSGDFEGGRERAPHIQKKLPTLHMPAQTSHEMTLHAGRSDINGYCVLPA